jgi:hypothetical protein
MPGSKKGYVSFIIFSILALLLLLPLSTQTTSTPSLASSYASQKTLSSHVALKRALAAGSQYAYDEAKLASNFASLGPNEKEEAIRLAVLAKWAQILNQYNSDPNFDATILCSPPIPGSLQPNISLPQNSILADPALWVSCAPNIYVAAGNIHLTKLIISQKVSITTIHVPTNTSATSDLYPMELV